MIRSLYRSFLRYMWFDTFIPYVIIINNDNNLRLVSDNAFLCPSTKKFGPLSYCRYIDNNLYPPSNTCSFDLSSFHLRNSIQWIELKWYIAHFHLYRWTFIFTHSLNDFATPQHINSLDGAIFRSVKPNTPLILPSGSFYSAFQCVPLCNLFSSLW